MNHETDEILELLKRATNLYSEAQDAYDFQAFAHSSSTREKAKEILLEAFRRSPVLQKNFSNIWDILQWPGSENVEFFHSDLENAIQILKSN